MKPLALFLLFANSLLAQSPDDIRLVNGIKVNLGPVHDWLITHKGERPMAHWKQIRIQEMAENMGGWQRCLVKIEDQPMTYILIGNIADYVRKAFASIADKETAMDSARAQVEQDKRSLEIARQRYRQGTGGLVTVSGSRVDSDATRENDLYEARRKLDRDSVAVEDRSREYLEAFQTIASETTVLGMFSGRDYAKLKIWDCGFKVN
jgi:hypothetical protein